jgi:nucleoside-diphosphate-sugar epimerase
MKTIFITGATGFLGSYFLYHLLQYSNDSIICLARNDRKATARTRVLEQLYNIHSSYKRIGINDNGLGEKIKNRLNVVSGDVTDENLGLIESFKEKSIYAFWHFAASVKFTESIDRMVTLVNLNGGRNVMKFIIDNKIPEFNYISTAYVAGQKTGKISENADTNLSPSNNVYEESKRTMEKEIINAHDKGFFNYRILRPSIIVGHSKTFEPDPSNGGLYGFLSLSFALKKDMEKRNRDYFKKNKIQILTDSHPKLSLITVDHVVDNLFRIKENVNSLNNIYHVTSTKQTKLTTLAAIINRLSNLHFEFVTDKKNFQAIDYLFDRKIQRFQCYLIFTKQFKKRKIDSAICTQNKKFGLDKKILYRLIERFYLNNTETGNRSYCNITKNISEE